jgi:hypothetical protein
MSISRMIVFHDPSPQKCHGFQFFYAQMGVVNVDLVGLGLWDHLHLESTGNTQIPPLVNVYIAMENHHV